MKDQPDMPDRKRWWVFVFVAAVFTFAVLVGIDHIVQSAFQP